MVKRFCHVIHSKCSLCGSVSLFVCFTRELLLLAVNSAIHSFLVLTGRDVRLPWLQVGLSNVHNRLRH